MSRRGKKGFTLVEVIVVLVVLAILAAILIPSMIGWIEKAEQRVIVADARNVYLAATASVMEQYALNKTEFAVSSNSTSIRGNACGRVTNNMLCIVQNGNVSQETSKCDAKIAELILAYLSSDDKNTADYRFTYKTNSVGKRVEDYHRSSGGEPGVIVCYMPDGTVGFIEFGYKKTLVHIDGATGALTVTQDGSYSREPRDPRP